MGTDELEEVGVDFKCLIDWNYRGYRSSAELNYRLLQLYSTAKYDNQEFRISRG